VYNTGQVNQAIEQRFVNIWDTSDEKRTGGPGHTSYTTYTSGIYRSTQDNRALVLQ
jgi:hypothetical protein